MSISASTSRHRPKSRPEARTIDAAKQTVPVIDLADLLCGAGGMRRVGGHWTARCPLPDHEDKTPSFVVYPDNHWHCFGCVRHGSVVDLAMRAWGIPEPKTAAAEVLLAFGHEIPQRPASWRRKQSRQRRARESYEEARVRITQRRLYRLLREDQLRIGGLEPDDAELELMWECAGAIAQRIIEDRMQESA